MKGDGMNDKVQQLRSKAQTIIRNQPTTLKYMVIGLGVTLVTAVGYVALSSGEEKAEPRQNDLTENVLAETDASREEFTLEQPAESLPVIFQQEPANPLLDNLELPQDGQLTITPYAGEMDPIGMAEVSAVEDDRTTMIDVSEPEIIEISDANTIRDVAEDVAPEIEVPHEQETVTKIDQDTADLLDDEIAKIEEDVAELPAVEEPKHEFGYYDSETDEDDSLSRSSVQVILEEDRQARVIKRAERIEKDRLERLTD